MKSNKMEKNKNYSNKQDFFDKKSTNLKEQNLNKNEEQDENVLHINDDYAKKFDEIKRREAIERAKLKYGKNYFFQEESEESEEESEDSVAELVNDKIMEKFVDTIVKLQDDEKVKELVQTDGPIFKEEDFENVQKKKPKNKEKAFTIKDALMKFEENPEEEQNDDLYSVNYQEKIFKKVDKEKEEFLKKVEEDENNLEGDDDFIDDGFLKVKKNSTNEEKYFKELEAKKLSNKNNQKDDGNEIGITEEISKIKFDDIIKKRKNIKNVDVLKKFFGEGESLDPNEKFLRNYILSEGWVENDEKFINRKMFLIDKEDEEKDQYFEEFEERYNFRYEEDGGANITTYKRDFESYRIKDDSNKIKRKEREKKKEEEKEKVISELKIAKDAKRKELKNKIENLEKISGTEKIRALADELEKDFDPENFDKIMNKIYDDDYYKIFDNEEDIKAVIEEKSFDYKTNTSIPDREKLLEIERLENEGYEEVHQEDKINSEKKFEDDKDEYGDIDENLYEENEWFFCDECSKLIKENKIKYECDTCEDYCLCKECFSSENHLHQMKKSKVPLGSKPPDNWRELIEQAKKLEEFLCVLCNEDIINNYYFICEECNDSKKYCKTCRGKGKSIHEHKLTKYVIEEEKIEELELDPRKKIEKIIDEKYDTAVDDLIAGKIPTKFHYSRVTKQQDNEDLTDDMILFLDDRTLNKYLPLKALAPYKEGYVVPNFKKKRLLSEFQREVEKKKKEFIKQIKQKEDIEQSNKNLLNKKKYSQKHKEINKKVENSIKDKEFDPNNKQEYRKKKRLETYGFTD